MHQTIDLHHQSEVDVKIFTKIDIYSSQRCEDEIFRAARTNGAVVTNYSTPIVRNFLPGLRPKSSLNKHRDLFIYLVTSQKGVNRGLRSFAYRFRPNYNHYSAPTISTSPYMGYADLRRWGYDLCAILTLAAIF